MAFTGLYTEYRYYSWFIFVYLYRAGTYDYWNGHEAICGFKRQTSLVKICISPCKAKQYVNSLRINPLPKEDVCKNT